MKKTKVLSLDKATVLLESGKYKLVWVNISAKYLLHFIGKYNEKNGLDSTYTVQYKTGIKLGDKFDSFTLMAGKETKNNKSNK